MGENNTKAKTKTKDRSVKNKAVPQQHFVTLKRAVLTAVFGIGLFIAAWVRLSHPIISIWVFYASCVVALFNVYTFIPAKSWNKKFERKLWKILFGIVVVLAFIITYLAQPIPEFPQRRFLVSTKVLLMSGSRDVAPYCWVANVSTKQAAPVPVAMYIVLTNTQSHPSTISSYSADMRLGNGEWVKLRHIPIGKGSGLEAVFGDIIGDMDVDGFDTNMSDGTILPFQPKSGWVFFDAPDYSSPQGEKVQFRFLLRDETDIPTAIVVSPPAASRETELVGAMARIRSKGSLNMADYEKLLFSEWFPNAN